MTVQKSWKLLNLPRYIRHIIQPSKFYLYKLERRSKINWQRDFLATPVLRESRAPSDFLTQTPRQISHLRKYAQIVSVKFWRISRRRFQDHQNPWITKGSWTIFWCRGTPCITRTQQRKVLRSMLNLWGFMALQMKNRFTRGQDSNREPGEYLVSMLCNL